MGWPSREALRARREAAQPRLREAVAAYRQLAQGEDLIGRLAALHGPAGDSYYGRECEGCDHQGWESEPPEWPCTTAKVIAEHHGLDLSKAYLINWEDIDVVSGELATVEKTGSN